MANATIDWDAHARRIVATVRERAGVRERRSMAVVAKLLRLAIMDGHLSVKEYERGDEAFLQQAARIIGG